MPLVNPIDIAALSSPIPIPENTGGGFDPNTQQNYTAMTRGSGVLSPIGSGNTMDLMPSQQFNSAAEYGSITGEALESGGSNVGGLVKTEQEEIPTDIKFTTQEDETLDTQETQYDDQVDEYQKAFDSGTEAEAKLREEESGLQTFARRSDNFFIDEGMAAARGVKRADRKDDRKARKEAGLKGKEKRLARKAQRKNRKSAFKDFKDNQLDDAYVDITNLEN